MLDVGWRNASMFTTRSPGTVPAMTVQAISNAFVPRATRKSMKTIEFVKIRNEQHGGVLCGRRQPTDARVLHFNPLALLF